MRLLALWAFIVIVFVHVRETLRVGMNFEGRLEAVKATALQRSPCPLGCKGTCVELLVVSIFCAYTILND